LAGDRLDTTKTPSMLACSASLRPSPMGGHSIRWLQKRRGLVAASEKRHFRIRVSAWEVSGEAASSVSASRCLEGSDCPDRCIGWGSGSARDLAVGIGAHVRMVEFFGGSPAIFVPDNLRRG
jgi:hypothetical protein